MTEATRRVIAAIGIPATLAFLATAPAGVLAFLAIWTGAAVITGLALGAIIANADRNRARQQAQREPVGEWAGQGGINFHKEAST